LQFHLVRCTGIYSERVLVLIFWTLAAWALRPEQLEQVADRGSRFGVGEGQSAVELKLFLAAEPFLVSALPPVREVHFRDGVREDEAAGLCEGLDDIAVADAVIEHDVDAFASGLREAGDFAVAAALATDKERICHNAEWGTLPFVDRFDRWLNLGKWSWPLLARVGSRWVPFGPGPAIANKGWAVATNIWAWAIKGWGGGD